MVVGWWDEEIARGWGILALIGGYQMHVLDIAWPSKMNGGVCRGSM
jgi:hypothetical protein